MFSPKDPLRRAQRVIATRTAPMGRPSSWQLATPSSRSCTRAIHRIAATGGWSRFETNTKTRAGMIEIPEPSLSRLGKARAKFGPARYAQDRVASASLGCAQPAVRAA
jgi:hypothetical protein